LGFTPKELSIKAHGSRAFERTLGAKPKEYFRSLRLPSRERDGSRNERRTLILSFTQGSSQSLATLGFDT
jgi:hypothetical protein